MITDVEYRAKKQKNGIRGKEFWKVEQHAKLGDVSMMKVLLHGVPRGTAVRVARLLIEAFELGADPLYSLKEATDEVK